MTYIDRSRKPGVQERHRKCLQTRKGDLKEDQREGLDDQGRLFAGAYLKARPSCLARAMVVNLKVMQVCP